MSYDKINFVNNSLPAISAENLNKMDTQIYNLTEDFENSVLKSGDETINGIKTFISSPIVPTPTTDFQVATKEYVDENSGISLSEANSFDIGVGQTWQDVTASRSAGVTYTNTTGKPICVNMYGSVDTNNFYIEVDGTIVSYSNESTGVTGAMRVNLSAIVPNNSTYKLTDTNPALQKWLELR